MVSRFENLTVFQPVINGVGGNLVAVQASRISTALHKQAELGTLLIPPGHTHPVIFITPIANFFGKGKKQNLFHLSPPIFSFYPLSFND